MSTKKYEDSPNIFISGYIGGIVPKQKGLEIVGSELVNALASLAICTVIGIYLVLLREFFLANVVIKRAHPPGISYDERIGEIVNRDVIQLNPTGLVDVLMFNPLFEDKRTENDELEKLANVHPNVMFMHVFSTLLHLTLSNESLPKSASFMCKCISGLENLIRTKYPEIAKEANITVDSLVAGKSGSADDLKDVKDDSKPTMPKTNI
ncbi:unnamed protein product [Protopolystoma xenopodis]|uniref:Uncharacterized protein n=1 Tax=Protopolystoma xenopodis TaxID=117903 RepID=A0A3S5A1E8_9PLAT|nr:unnamed protein product [Protopolystoma xenopodis]